MSEWRSEANSVAPHLRKKAEGEKEAAAKSNKTAAEIEQLSQEIDKKAEAEISGERLKPSQQFNSGATNRVPRPILLIYSMRGSAARSKSIISCGPRRRGSAPLWRNLNGMSADLVNSFVKDGTLLKVNSSRPLGRTSHGRCRWTRRGLRAITRPHLEWLLGARALLDKEPAT